MNPTAQAIANGQEVQVDRHWIGSVGYAVLGSLGIILVSYLFLISFSSKWAAPWQMVLIGCLSILLLLALTLVALRVYFLSHFTLTKDGLTVVQWNTLLSKSTTITQWSDVQDVTSSTPFAVLGFGTVLAQDAGTQQRIRLTFVPDADTWAQVIDELQGAATPSHV
jgi:hypothetical protein